MHSQVPVPVTGVVRSRSLLLGACVAAWRKHAQTQSLRRFAKWLRSIETSMDSSMCERLKYSRSLSTGAGQCSAPASPFVAWARAGCGARAQSPSVSRIVDSSVASPVSLSLDRGASIDAGCSIDDAIVRQAAFAAAAGGRPSRTRRSPEAAGPSSLLQKGIADDRRSRVSGEAVASDGAGATSDTAVCEDWSREINLCLLRNL
jgi:hypothetical protein